MPNTRVIRRADGWPRCAKVTHIMKHPLELSCLYEWQEETKKKSLRRGKLIKSCQVVQVKFLRCSWPINDHPFVPYPAYRGWDYWFSRGTRLPFVLPPLAARKQHRNQVRGENQRPSVLNEWMTLTDNSMTTTERMAERSKWHWEYLNKDLLIVDNVNCSRVWEQNAEEDNFFTATRSLSPSLTTSSFNLSFSIRVLSLKMFCRRREERDAGFEQKERH